MTRSDKEALAYHEGCRAICKALDIVLIGTTPNRGLNYNIPGRSLGGAYGDHEMPHDLIVRLEKFLPSEDKPDLVEDLARR